MWTNVTCHDGELAHEYKLPFGNDSSANTQREQCGIGTERNQKNNKNCYILSSSSCQPRIISRPTRSMDSEKQQHCISHSAIWFTFRVRQFSTFSGCAIFTLSFGWCDCERQRTSAAIVSIYIYIRHEYVYILSVLCVISQPLMCWLFARAFSWIFSVMRATRGTHTVHTAIVFT